jgi:hypothetical protein
MAGPLLGLVVERGNRGRRGCGQGLQLGSKGSELEQKGSSRAIGRGPRQGLHTGKPGDLGGDGRRDRVHKSGKLGPFLLSLVLELKEGTASGLKVGQGFGGLCMCLFRGRQTFFMLDEPLFKDTEVT